MTGEMRTQMLASMAQGAVVLERERGAGRDGPGFREDLAVALAGADGSPVVVRVDDPALVQEDLVLAGDKAGLAVVFAGAGDDLSAQGAVAGLLNSVASTGPASSVALVVEFPEALDEQDLDALVALRGHLATAVLVLVGP